MNENDNWCHRVTVPFVILLWVLPLVELPFYYGATMNMAASDGAVASISFGDFVLLGIGPSISLMAFLAILYLARSVQITFWRILILLLPTLLSLAELTFAFRAWKAG